jgi:three-Cys-motif partner protein
MSHIDPYAGREQTKAKHFILKRYLQALAFKVLTISDITYVDGFSGPWKSNTEDFSDSSFMIALQVLQDAQRKIFERDGVRRKIKCFFSEIDTEAFRQLQTAVAPFNKPDEDFEVETFCGKFEEAVPQIKKAIGNSFALIFIDPTGWTGFAFEKIKEIFSSRLCEVLINFMYDHVNRFVASQDTATIASLDPILGGPGWRDRLDLSLPRGLAVEKLFRESLQSAGKFAYVISTKIDRNTVDRPHFFIAYATKNQKGLITFRQTEYEALREQARSRAAAKERRQEQRSNMTDMFSGHEADVQEETIDQIVEAQKTLASAHLLEILSNQNSLKFSRVVHILLQAFILRETNVKDICVDLEKENRIDKTWGRMNKKPKDSDLITLKAVNS